MDTLDDETLRRVSARHSTRISRTPGIIHIGRPAAQGHLFRRVLHLVRDADSHRLAVPRSLGARTAPTA